MNKSFRNTMHFGVLRDERIQGRALHAFESGGRVRDQEQNAPKSESNLHHAPATSISVREPRTRSSRIHRITPDKKSPHTMRALRHRLTKMMPRMVIYVAYCSS